MSSRISVQQSVLIGRSCLKLGVIAGASTTGDIASIGTAQKRGGPVIGGSCAQLKMLPWRLEKHNVIGKKIALSSEFGRHLFENFILWDLDDAGELGISCPRTQYTTFQRISPLLQRSLAAPTRLDPRDIHDIFWKRGFNIQPTCNSGSFALYARISTQSTA